MARNIKGSVVKYFKDHPGTHVFAEELASELNATRGKVLGSVANIIRLGHLPGLQRVQKGGPWMYKPNSDVAEKKAAKPLFELVAKTKKGDTILQDEEGNLYRATELE